ncbi:MAG: hypothetical protein Q8Q39_01915 [bacterium]|nr:hypothetical protein [bacterium]
MEKEYHEELNTSENASDREGRSDEALQYEPGIGIRFTELLKEQREVINPEKMSESSAETDEYLIESVEKRAQEMVVEGQMQVDGLEQELGMPQDDIIAVREEMDFNDHLRMIRWKASEMVDAMRIKLFGRKPIESGEIFSPELEMRIIREASKNERPALIREFKEKLAFQKKGLARMQKEIIQKIRKNPDAQLGELYRWVDEAAPSLGLTYDQTEEAREMLSAYAEKHANVRCRREEFPDDKALYKALFGQEPRGEVKVVEGPITLYFRCFDPADYARIHRHAWEGEDITEKDLQIANMSGGVSIGDSRIPGLEGAIIAENSHELKITGLRRFNPDVYRNRRDRSHKILAHEEQHAIKRLFGERLERRSTWKRFRKAENDEERITILKSELRYGREEFADERARDEILAYFTEGLYGVYERLTQPKAQGGIYDYLDGVKERVIKNFTIEFGEEFKPLYEKTASAVLDAEYKQLLKSGINAVHALYKEGHDKQEIIALLIQEPLARWEKVVRRQLHERKE